MLECKTTTFLPKEDIILLQVGTIGSPNKTRPTYGHQFDKARRCFGLLLIDRLGNNAMHVSIDETAGCFTNRLIQLFRDFAVTANKCFLQFVTFFIQGRIVFGVP